VIPHELVNLTRQGRVIPFIGAGFSSIFNLPDWEKLLKGFADRTDDGLSFDEVMEYSSGEFLQVAEYYYLKTRLC
jgi:hypothetical protein